MFCGPSLTSLPYWTHAVLSFYVVTFHTGDKNSVHSLSVLLYPFWVIGGWSQLSLVLLCCRRTGGKYTARATNIHTLICTQQAVPTANSPGSQWTCVACYYLYASTVLGPFGPTTTPETFKLKVRGYRGKIITLLTGDMKRAEREWEKRRQRRLQWHRNTDFLRGRLTFLSFD